MKFSFVCATKNSERLNNCEAWYGQPYHPKWELPLSNLEIYSHTYDIHMAYENTLGLGEVYNKYFECLDSDYIICLHDDVVINDINFFDKIEDYCKMFDILGVAGGCNFSFKRHNRLSWMSVLDQKTDLAGAVQHRMSNEGETPEIFSTCNYGPVPRKAFAIDGLIMVFSKKAYKSVRFDPQFKFDFYDLDLCFSAFKNVLSIGVVPISVTHYSKGEGLLADRYLEAQAKFIQKWNKS